MTRPRTSRGSGFKLAAFFSLILIPVALVLGPFRDIFYPPAATEASALADLVAPEFSVFQLAEGDAAWQAARDALQDAYARGDYAAVTAQLERRAATPSPDGVLLLDGVSLLLQRRPGPAMIRLQQVSGPLAPRAAWATAQCHLILGQVEDARRVLDELAAGPEELAARARDQREALDRILPPQRKTTP